MTFDEKFSRAYRASVEAALEPADLTDRILKATEAAKSSTATNTRKQAPFWRRPALIGACAAASLALVAALPAIMPALEETLHSAPSVTDTDEQPASTSSEKTATAPAQSDDASLLPGLSVKAYAADGSEFIVPEWSKGRSYFWGEPYTNEKETPIALFYPGGASGTGADTMWPEDDGSITRAYFMADTFTLEGSNIERIQIHVSGGELYLQSVDTDVHGDDKVGEEGLDPRQRGTRDGYEDCDALSYYDWMEQDAEGHWWTHENVFRMKRMGQVIDLSKSDDERVGTRNIQFGLLSLATTSARDKSADWMADGHFVDTLADPECAFDGVRLTITATFSDGTCETQVIDLHRDLVLADEGGVAPAQPVQLYEDVFDKRNTTAVDLAYGTLASKTNEPFPYADKMANQYADAVMPPMPAWSQPYSTD